MKVKMAVDTALQMGYVLKYRNGFYLERIK